MMYPKDPRQINKHLTDMAADRHCLLRIPGVCKGEGVVACHSNQLKHGKARALKAHDFYTVWGCCACHAWIDGSHSASMDEKFGVFDGAHKLQIHAWAAMAQDPLENPKARNAARWAVANLKSRGVETNV